MGSITLNVDPNTWNDVYRPYIACNIPTQILFGGGSSGKSLFLSRRGGLDVFRQPRNYLVIRNVANTIKGSVWNEITKALRFFKIYNYWKINKSESTIINKLTGYGFYFRGLDNTEKVKSVSPERGVFTDIWIEEATEITELQYNDLLVRQRGESKMPKRVIMSFNPVYRNHWIFKRFFKNWRDNDKIYIDDKLLILKTTYRDNRFLSEQEIKRLEQFKESSPYHYNVYCLGNWGVLGKLIITNWEVRDLSSEFDRFDNFRNGLDFGYTNDPTAFIRSSRLRDDNELYILAETGGRGWSNQYIAGQVKPIIGSDILKCDCAEPKSIDELITYDIAAQPCKKGKDSVLHGIQWLQTKKIIVHTSCQNPINELSIWQWQRNKHGEYINKPVDANNHWMDALRYAWDDEINSDGGPGIYTFADYQRDMKNGKMGG